MALPGHNALCLCIMVGLEFGALCSWHLPPSWFQLLPLRTCSPNSASKCNHPSSVMWMRLLLPGPKGAKNQPPLMLLPIISRHGTHSEYHQLQTHYLQTLLIKFTCRARSLVASCKESGAWLNAYQFHHWNYAWMMPL